MNRLKVVQNTETGHQPCDAGGCHDRGRLTPASEKSGATCPIVSSCRSLLETKNNYFIPHRIYECVLFTCGRCVFCYVRLFS